MNVQKEYSGAKHNLAAALQNESAEHRAKVLEFVLDWEINPNEEFFLIFAAIGHLKVLIEQAPEDIRQLFKSVLQELDEWSQITTEKLQIDSQHIKVTESLAQSSKALGTALNSLDITSTQLLEQLKSLPELLKLLKAVEGSLPSTNLLFQKWIEAVEKERIAATNLLTLIQHVENHMMYSSAHLRGTYEKVEKIEALIEKLSGNKELIQQNQLQNKSQNQQKNKSLLNLLNLIELLGVGRAAWSYRLKVLGVLTAILVAFNFVVGNVVKGAVASALESTAVVLPVDVIQKLDYASEQSGYATVKLQRIEKALGIKKKQS
ncbi:DUF6753 family protein [Iningainema tapete]|uniref:Uncharacterized protein n=1 Tax=Iningainema tapete BLCC-T55 TaxID=2748662 RepID=A0A8J6X9W4_9CYAN|nr:DUF6753 family protein [Iningainema tapete]MBD2770675.1 hypothetical protein [Iningainema tapete BLCC-T55]